MREIDIQNLQAELLRLYEEKKLKDWILLCKDGVPLAHLHWSICDWTKPGSPSAGSGKILPSFFEPLPADLLAAFTKEECEGVEP